MIPKGGRRSYYQVEELGFNQVVTFVHFGHETIFHKKRALVIVITRVCVMLSAYVSWTN